MQWSDAISRKPLSSSCPGNFPITVVANGFRIAKATPLVSYADMRSLGNHWIH
jgi:hypothetical protein